MMVKKIKAIYEKFGDLMMRVALTKAHRKEVSGYTEKQVLTNEQKKAATEFFKPYSKISLIYHNFYTEKTGEFHPEYMPDDEWYNDVIAHFNNLKDARALDNKCFYPRMFPGIKQPETVLFRMNGFWYTEDMRLISLDEAKEIFLGEKALFVKQAAESCGGHGVEYIEISDEDTGDFLRIAKQFKGDLVLQRPIRQHKDIAALNESSVNTLRILSLLRDEEVKIYSSVIRMGKAGSKVDNACSGGVNCGINEDGTLKKYAHTWSGLTFDKHPTSDVVFENYQLPNFDKVIELVKKAHKLIPHFRLVSWDIAIGEDGEPMLVETNLRRGGLLLHQLNNGPVFGSDTKDILDEVFKK